MPRSGWRDALTMLRAARMCAVVVLAFVLVTALFLSGGHGAFAPRPTYAASFCAVTGDESLQADQQHYVPAETVYLTGTGFAPSCDVGVAVVFPDDSVDLHIATTDANGNLDTSYALGSINGEYSIELRGENLAQLTAIVFTNGPIVTLDKGDYRPDETVHVTGTAYPPLTPITVQVTLPDGGVVTDNIATDESGSIAWDYVLLNGVRADYLVDVLDQSGAVLASTSFTDSVAFVKNIGTNQKSGSGNASIDVTVPLAGVAAGNSIIVGVAVAAGAGAVSCSDTKGNTYAVDADKTGAGRVFICSAHNVTALASGDKITANYPSANNDSSISANEFSGLTSNPLDQIKTDSANTNAPTSGSTPATTQNDELLFGAIFFSGASNSSFTAGTGPCTGSPTGTYTLTNVPLAQGTASGRGLATEYRIATTTGTYAACGTLTSSNQWAAAIATYKVGAATTLTVTKV